MALRLAAVIFGWLVLAQCVRGEVMEEYQVKAAFLYNFAKFIEWPAEVFRTPRDPMVVCVLGNNPFGGALEDVIRGKSIEGRPFAYRPVADGTSAQGCQILFVPNAESRHFRSIQGELKNVGILTVGEAPGFASDGGVINFKLDDGRVRFEINLDAAERRGIHISSKLLSLAQIVKTGKTR